MVILRDELQVSLAMGIGVVAEVYASVDNPQLGRDTSGEGNCIHFGSTCVVCIIEVPCLYVTTPSRGITGKVLTDTLHNLDQLGVIQ